MRPLYIFDLDGTLALIEHRRHFVEKPKCLGCDDSHVCTQCFEARKTFKPNWDAFHAACIDDTPNKPVIDVMHGLLETNNDVWVFSGRSDTVRIQTEDWLTDRTNLFGYMQMATLRMRKAGDYTPDDVLKKSWYDGMSRADKDRLVATFDDRNRVVKMWRDLGITCFQVAPGDF